MGRNPKFRATSPASGPLPIGHPRGTHRSQVFQFFSYFDLARTMTDYYKKSSMIYKNFTSIFPLVYKASGTLLNTCSDLLCAGLTFYKKSPHSPHMNFTESSRTSAEKRAVQHLTEVYLDNPFTGSEEEMALIMMMFRNKQGSVGVEEILCNLLGLTQNNEKHGFDGIDSTTGIMYELKPSQSATATYNDVTEGKLRTMKNDKDNKVIFEVHIEGKLLFIAKVAGKLMAEILEERYNNKKRKIQSGDDIGSRQTHNISLLGFIKRFGVGEVEVLFYKKNALMQKKLLHLLNLTENVNKLDI